MGADDEERRPDRKPQPSRVGLEAVGHGLGESPIGPEDAGPAFGGFDDFAPPAGLPLPDLADGPDRIGPRWNVRLLAFRDPVAAAPALAEAFQLDEPTAMQLAASLPRTVKRGVSRGEAERYAVVLRDLGAKVAVSRDEGSAATLPPGEAPVPSLPAPAEQAAPGGTWSPTTPPPAAASSPGPGTAAPGDPSVPPSSLAPASVPPGQGAGVSDDPHAAARAAVEAASQSSEAPGAPGPAPAHPGFWPRVPAAILVPFRGGGLRLVFGVSAATGLGTMLLLLTPGFGFFRLVLLFAFSSAVLGAHAHVFTQFAQAGVHDRGGPLPAVTDQWPSYAELFFRGLSLMALVGLLFGLFLWSAFRGGAGPLMLVGVALAYAYWPMALSVQAISGRALGIFDVPTVLRGVLAAPGEYAVVVLLGVAVLAFAGTLTALVSGASMLGGIVGQSATIALVGFAFVQGLSAFAATLLAAVQGYLMGCLVGSQPARFAFL